MNPADQTDQNQIVVSADDPTPGAGVPDGARLVVRLPASASATDSRHASVIVPHPDLTVRLAERGFVIDAVTPHALHARKTSTVIRGYRDGDEHAIRELFRRSFHHELSPELWHWRYRAHPLGARRISVAWDADGTLVGHYGGYPMAFHSAGFPGAGFPGVGFPGVGFPRAGEILHAHQNGDVMTDRRARRLGRGDASIVRRLAQHFWAAYGEGRVDFHYGFNTGTARELQKRVVPGVRVLEPVTTWVRDDPASASTAIAGALADTHNTGLQAERVTRFDVEWNAFASRAHDHDFGYGLFSRRDADYMNWRYVDRPDSDDLRIIVRAHGRIVGGAVFQRHRDETRWGDALFDPREPAALGVMASAAAALAALRETGAAPRTRAWFPARPDWWARVLIQLGFRQMPEPNGLSLVYVPFTPAAERLLPNLYYSWGDSDLF